MTVTLVFFAGVLLGLVFGMLIGWTAGLRDREEGSCG